MDTFCVRRIKKENCFASCVVILRCKVKVITDKKMLDFGDATNYLKRTIIALSDEAYSMCARVYKCIPAVS